MFYINISIPLGEQRVGAYMRNQGDKTTYGLQNNGSLSKDTHYYISADRDAKTSKIASTVISIAISITLNSAWAAALMAIITATITQPSAGHRCTRTWHNVLALHHQKYLCYRTPE